MTSRRPVASRDRSTPRRPPSRPGPVDGVVGLAQGPVAGGRRAVDAARQRHAPADRQTGLQPAVQRALVEIVALALVDARLVVGAAAA